MYFEDFTPGFRYGNGSKTLTREAIMAFAGEWDPQPFHVDEEAAADTPYGGLIASGWHTLAVAHTLLLEAVDWTAASLGSPGLENVQWLRPVRPGDSLRVEGEVLTAQKSRSRPDRGFARARYEIFNQKDEKVAEYTATHMLRCRPAD